MTYRPPSNSRLLWPYFDLVFYELKTEVPCKSDEIFSINIYYFNVEVLSKFKVVKYTRYNKLIS